MDPKFVPVGTVIAYSGEVAEQYEALEKSGWLLCDGREFDESENAELFAEIKTSFGSQAKGVYNIPDLRGLFIRGVNGSSGADPDADSRKALMAGGNTGNTIGSYQEYATGVPRNPFQATISNNDIVSMKLDAATDAGRSGYAGEDDTGAWTDGSGGDLETRPKNKYVHYLIKKSRLDQYNDPVMLPIGSIIPFAGMANTIIEQQYIKCMGQALPIVGQFQYLFNAIQYVHGKPKEGYFNLPDYQGQFLRGVDSQAPEFRRDPDADKRTPPFPDRPEGDRGNAGDKVGSAQMDATGYPLSAGFFTKIPRLPYSEGKMAMDGLVKTTLDWNAGGVDVNVTESGGDAETRPVNYAVDWYIKFI